MLLKILALLCALFSQSFALICHCNMTVSEDPQDIQIFKQDAVNFGIVENANEAGIVYQDLFCTQDGTCRLKDLIGSAASRRGLQSLCVFTTIPSNRNVTVKHVGCAYLRGKNVKKEMCEAKPNNQIFRYCTTNKCNVKPSC